MISREPSEIIDDIVSTCAAKDVNEATTRLRIIDLLMKDVLGWPVQCVECEVETNSGRADYILANDVGRGVVVIEAKKEGVYFELPHNLTVSPKVVKIKRVISSKSIKEAMEQAKNYALSQGCLYCVVTNGIQWVVYRVFEEGKKWDDTLCYVIPSVECFKNHYTEVYNNLSYEAICRNNSLSTLLTARESSSLMRYNPSNGIHDFNFKIYNNRLASYLRPIAKKFFSDLSVDDYAFMKSCYVEPARYSATYKGFSDVIHDRVSPFFVDSGVKDFSVDEEGGFFGEAVRKKIQKKASGDVLVLFGGKGAGKSTFLKKFFYHSPPSFLYEKVVVMYIDMLLIPEERRTIQSFIWKELVSQLDIDEVLLGDRVGLVQLYNDKFETACRQTLAGLAEDSAEYNLRLNSAIQRWKNNKELTAANLAKRLRERGKTLVVVLDNTDQYDPDMQDYCFAIAQDISSRIECTCVVSMREERFFSSKIRGVLDAFQNFGFHLTSPLTQYVFYRRLKFVLDILQNKISLIDVPDSGVKNELCRFVGIFIYAFRNKTSPFYQFMTACSHGNIRFALEIFRQYVTSGYLAVDEWLSSGGVWTIQNHQVVKPMMIPERFYYDESESMIPNIYHLRSTGVASHFTSARILHKLIQVYTPQHPQYIDVAMLRREFIDYFDMNKDFEINMDIMLAHGLIEANNRLDKYSDAIDSVKVTAYGVYFYNELMCSFTYIDLICSSCSVHSESLSNCIARSSNMELALFKEKNPRDRVGLRIDKVEQFVNYLSEEESREHEMYQLPDDFFKFMPRLRGLFDEEKKMILKSVKRNYCVGTASTLRTREDD